MLADDRVSGRSSLRRDGGQARAVRRTTRPSRTRSGSGSTARRRVSGRPTCSLIACVGLSALSLVGRWRRGGPLERAQLKWVAAAAALVAAVMVGYAVLIGPASSTTSPTSRSAVALGFFPVAIGIAILRYRLFEIDRLVSRTIAYVVVTALLIGAYASVILLLQGPLGAVTGGETISVALSTLVAAALFQPLRRRVQAIVDRRFDRARFDAERTSAAFSERLRGETDIAALSEDLDATVRASLRPTGRRAVAARGPGLMLRRWLIRIVSIASISVVVVVALVDVARGWPSGGFYALYGAIAAVFVVVGWLIAERKPSNAVGPLLVTFGAIFAWYLPVDQYLHQPESPPAAAYAALAVSILDAPMFILVALALIVFPDGRLPSRRWRWVVVAATLGIVAAATGYALDPDPFPLFPEYASPFGMRGFPGDAFIYAAYGVMMILLLGAAGALVLRWRRGGALERTQIKWVVAASVAMLVAEVVNVATFRADEPNALSNVLASIAIALVPVSMGIAILRYRLYEIDRIISRSIAYAIVTGILVSVYAAGILLLQARLSTFTQGQTVAVAASTLAVFALFQPVRRRVQRSVDHRFDRARYDAERTVTAFSDRLRNETDMETVTEELTRTVESTVAPTTLAIWSAGHAMSRDGRLDPVRRGPRRPRPRVRDPWRHPAAVRGVVHGPPSARTRESAPPGDPRADEPGRSTVVPGRVAGRRHRDLERVRPAGSGSHADLAPGGPSGVVGDAMFVVPIVVAVVGVPLVFPDGHLPSRRFRVVVACMVIGLAGWMLGAVADVRSDMVVLFDLPDRVRWGCAATVVRFRRPTPYFGRRSGLAAAVGVAAVAVMSGLLLFDANGDLGTGLIIVGVLALATMPLAIANAILRYRLYDIDRIISRSIGYAVVTGILAVVFAGAILLLQGALAPFTQGQTVAVAASTLAVFALFQPLRRRIQRTVDRRFDRAKYDADLTIVGFSSRLRHDVDLGVVRVEILHTASAAVRPTAAGIWLRGE